MSDRPSADAAPCHKPRRFTAFHLRLMLGYILAPALPGLVMWLLLSIQGHPVDLVKALGELIFIVAATSLVTVPITVTLGIPAHIVCHFLGRRSWWVFVVGGMVIGGLGPLIYLAPNLDMAAVIEGRETIGSVLKFGLQGTPFGALAATGLWVVAYAKPRLRYWTLLALLTLLVLAALSRSLFAS